MLQNLRKWIASARRRAELRALIGDAEYYRRVIADANRRLEENRRRQNEIIAEDRGELPQVPANAWSKVELKPGSGERIKGAITQGEAELEAFVRAHGGDEIEVAGHGGREIYGTAVFEGERRAFKIVAEGRAA